MDLSLSHTLRLFNIFRECDGKENCAQVLEEECIKMLGTKSLYDEHDCNVVTINSLYMIFFVPQVLMRIFIMMIACPLFMMIILMKVWKSVNSR